MKNSIKQLLRTPVRALLFFLLLTAGTTFLVLGTGLYARANRRIALAEQEFTTIGTVEQEPGSVLEVLLPNACSPTISTAQIKQYNNILSAECLEFEGANYLTLPESRIYYLSYMPELQSVYGGMGTVDDVYVLEFTPLEEIMDSSVAGEVQVEKIWYAHTSSNGIYLDSPAEGATISLCNHFVGDFTGLSKGKRYIATIVLDYLSDFEHGKIEYAVYTAPFSTQVGKDGALETLHALSEDSGGYFYTKFAFRVSPEPGSPVYAEEVTEDFDAENGRGQIWKTWAEQLGRLGKEKSYFYVLSTNSLELLPQVHERNFSVTTGRKITKEEFEIGAQVCMLPEELRVRNGLEIGDKIPLSLIFSQHGKWQPASSWCSAFSGSYSPINADGKSYMPFYDAKYEIVGTYSLNNLVSVTSEFTDEMLIIPAKSVGASDRDNIVYSSPMNAMTTSFEIPNGSIEEFDRKLHEFVPEAAELTITYDDNGYSDVIDSLNASKIAAALLLLAGIFSVFAIVLLLLYFFIVKEKKRTAIERSLGMTKRQCRISLLTGIMAIALASAILGSVGGGLALEHIDFSPQEETMDEDYSVEYSLWALTEEPQVELEADTPTEIFFLVPLGLLLALFPLALLAVNRNLKIEPIYLLSVKADP